MTELLKGMLSLLVLLSGMGVGRNKKAWHPA